MSIAKINDLIDNEKFEHHFQALYDLYTLTPIGYEALLRTDLFKNPEILFEKASHTNRFFELEMRSIKKALQAYNTINQRTYNNKKILINVFPNNLADPEFLGQLNNIIGGTNLSANQIIIEINESEIIQNVHYFRTTVKKLKSEGYLIAIDDVGKGVSSLQAIVELRPDFVKMDRYFAKHLAKSSRKQEMVKSIVTYCLNTNTKFVLEGVEILEDLEMAKSIGVSIVQGFLLARPEPLEVIKKFEMDDREDDHFTANK
ncbi:EAL domain, c-di-GMP-specific phosphodiesterase class I (or its enzymatically inactive variant) [Gracilibacillus orientalis]|uniref:EAL domain, c-di-GMP-specific phosphodiesterase class I (Or its enzymatically inactive variant) n=1 Tax=Gracilibacillus orientalis TaxID=334253 RepID=A0A1I4P7T9_9BACI|nr:EAL domain-containing protein [Gracilibacillus orientalis]SFM23433.1 EAL domain, c-di-GMP-specific phosphodiesterase class I (or its enzymatically inactive variant) [Gracilibacillus orientalis]